MNVQSGRRPSSKAKSSTVVLLLLLLLFVYVYTCYQQRQAPANPDYKTADAVLQGLQIPAFTSSDQIIEHRGYTLSFIPHHQQAAWVAYILRGYQLKESRVEREGEFMVDPLAKPHSADDADYNNSGYDRGHLAAAEDMSWSALSMKESFYYSNASPQAPAFNRGVWKRLEELVRYWAEAYDSVYVVTGPVLQNGLRTIGHDNVSVPQTFYKAVLVYNAKAVQGIGFVLRNEASAATLKSFAVSIDNVERLTGLDFFPKLPDDAEQKIEGNFKETDWLWTRARK